MSKVRARDDYGFVGHEGVPVLVNVGDEYDDDHALVLARPELFDAVPEAPKRPTLGRPKLKGTDD